MRLRLQAERAQPKNQQQNIFFLPRFEKNIFYRIFEIIIGVTLYQIVGKYVSFFSFCRMATARKPRKAVFQSKRKRRLYVQGPQGPAKAAGQTATTLAIISHTLGNFCRPATAVSSLGSSPQPYENLGLFFLNFLQTITCTVYSLFVSRKNGKYVKK